MMDRDCAQWFSRSKANGLMIRFRTRTPASDRPANLGYFISPVARAPCVRRAPTVRSACRVDGNMGSSLGIEGRISSKSYRRSFRNPARALSRDLFMSIRTPSLERRLSPSPGPPTPGCHVDIAISTGPFVRSLLLNLNPGPLEYRLYCSPRPAE